MTPLPTLRLVLILLLLAGCSQRASDNTGATPGAGTPPATDGGTTPPPPGGDTAETPEPVEPPPTHDWTAGIVDGESSDGRMTVLRSVREASHAGYDRVVFEFDEGSRPGYHIEYIDRPVRQCGSGEVVPIAGDAWLEVRFVPAQAHTDAGEPTVTERDRLPGLPIVKQIVSTCDFEGHVTWVLGVSSPNRYRVFELAAPTRLVIDVRH